MLLHSEECRKIRARLLDQRKPEFRVNPLHIWSVQFGYLYEVLGPLPSCIDQKEAACVFCATYSSTEMYKCFLNSSKNFRDPFPH